MTTCIISQEVHKIKSFSVFDRCFRVLVIWEVSVYHTSIMKTSEDLRVVFFFSPFRTPVSLYAIQKTSPYWCTFPANNHDYKLYNVYRNIIIIRIWGSVDLKYAEKIFGRHKAQNLKQSNLLLVQKIYPYITSRKTAFPCKSFWRHILYWFFKVILLS